MIRTRCHGRHSEPCHPNHCLCPPKRELCPPSEGCAPKKVTGLVPMEWVQSTTGDPWNTDLSEKEPICRRFCGEDLFFSFFGLHPRNRALEPIFRRFCGEELFFGLHTRVRGNEIFVPPQKIVYAPVTLLWRQVCNDCDLKQYVKTFLKDQLFFFFRAPSKFFRSQWIAHPGERPSHLENITKQQAF